MAVQIQRNIRVHAFAWVLMCADVFYVPVVLSKLEAGVDFLEKTPLDCLSTPLGFLDARFCVVGRVWWSVGLVCRDSWPCMSGFVNLYVRFLDLYVGFLDLYV